MSTILPTCSMVLSGRTSRSIGLCIFVCLLLASCATLADSSPKGAEEVVASAQNAAPEIKAPDVKVPVEGVQKVKINISQHFIPSMSIMTQLPVKPTISLATQEYRC